MRQIGKLSSNSAATALADYLLTQGIPSKVEQGHLSVPGAEEWILWGVNEDQIDPARQIFERFLENPDAPEFQASRTTARAIRRQELKEKKDREKKSYDANRLWAQPRWRDIPVTSIFIAISVCVGLYTNFGAKEPELIDRLQYRSFIGHLIQFQLQNQATPDQGDQTEEAPFDFDALLAKKSKFQNEDIFRGELWRLITPIFIHYGPLHLLFNMLWLHSLGGVLEVRRGSGKLLGMILVIAACSNISQAQLSPNPFGGMSGVVYGLFVYIWVRGVVDPLFGFGIHPQQVVFMMLWMFLGVSMPGMHMANGAHIGGAVTGVILALLSWQLRRLLRAARSGS